MLYKVLEDEKVYTWNASTNEYAQVSGSTSAGEGKNNIIVVEKYADLPEIGEADVLYKVAADQLFYTYNTITNAYQQMGQGGGVATEGYTITLQNTIDRIFAAIEGDPITIGFRYSSVDATGFADGPGIGTLIVNNVKKATVAIPQKVQTLDITKYLSLGENNVELTVENSESNSKTLAFSIEVVNLYLTTNVKDMDTYFSETAIPFTITGPGTKLMHYIIDDEEIASEEVTSTTQLAHSYRVPMQEAGAHILKIYAEREVNNMTITSNTLVIGMMFVTDEMVDTHILSNFQ